MRRASSILFRNVLQPLESGRTLSIKKLKDRAGLDYSNTRKLVRRLATAGFVSITQVRDPVLDRPILAAKITRQGKDFLLGLEILYNVGAVPVQFSFV